MRMLAKRGWVVAGAVALAGCAQYRLGSMLPADVRAISVAVAQNQTDEPMLENEVTRALIAEIQRDGSLRVEPAGLADADLRVTIRRYEVAPIGYGGRDRSDPDEYRIRIEAAFALVRSGSDTVVAESPAAVGEATMRLTGSWTLAREQAIPIAARDLARDIVRRLVENW